MQRLGIGAADRLRCVVAAGTGQRENSAPSIGRGQAQKEYDFGSGFVKGKVAS